MLSYLFTPVMVNMQECGYAVMHTFKIVDVLLLF